MFPVCTLSSEISDQKQSYIINPKEFIGFEKCKVGELLYTTLEKMHKDGIPIKKDKGILMFKVKSEFLDLPIIKIIIGVCEDGSRDCGWGEYLGLIIPKSIMETDLLLKKKTGIDFRNESRGFEAGETLRPILVQSVEDKNESILFCDPGAL
jgi:hypothetical protein